MGLSYLRTKLCKMCMVVVLAVIGFLSLSLWYRAMREGSVELVIPANDDSGKALSITILPEDPTIQEGYTAQLVCIVTGATVTEFSPPPSLPPSLHSSVLVSMMPGGAVMVVESVKMAHAGIYTCHARGTKMQELNLSVELVVNTDVTASLESKQQSSSSSPFHSPSSPASHITSPSVISLTVSQNTSTPSPTSRTPSLITKSTSSPTTTHTTSSTVRTVDLHQSIAAERRYSFHFRKTNQYRRERMVPPALPDDDDMPRELGEKDTTQRAAVQDYCMKYDPHPSALSHPYAYSRHMLVDYTHNVTFCFLPKVGCTNLKLLFFVSQGLIPRSELNKSRDKINQEHLMNVVRNSSLMNFHRIFKNCHYYHRKFFKYVMVRHPLERLASAFRSKIERYNLTGKYRDTPHYNWARRVILMGTHPLQYQLWIRSGMKPVAISFSDFIDYWLDPKDSGFQYDDHFMSMLQICQPCRTRFTFYGNFRHFDRDAQVLVDKIGASSSDLRQGYYSEETVTSTDQRMKLYYSTLSDEQKRAVLRKLALELEFHYTIFPEERDSHKQILGTDADIEPFYNPFSYN